MQRDELVQELLNASRELRLVINRLSRIEGELDIHGDPLDVEAWMETLNDVEGDLLAAAHEDCIEELDDSEDSEADFVFDPPSLLSYGYDDLFD